MLRAPYKAPLSAAFFYISVLIACNTDQPAAGQVIAQCPANTTPIALVQGNATESPMLGQQINVKGVVTLLQNGQGLYIEEPESDSDERTSNAVYIETKNWPEEIEQGSLINVAGTVSEIGGGRYSMTAITGVQRIVHCSNGQALPLTDINLPLNGPGREALEGMRITIEEPMTVTDVYQFRRGNITLSGSGLQYAPTEVSVPGRDAADLQRQNRAFTLPVFLEEGVEQPGLLINGTTIEDIIGVVGHDGKDLRVSLQSISPGPLASFAAPVAPGDGSVRVVGLNLHNYFNGDGGGRGFPTSRGAETSEEFQQQRSRIGAAIAALDPHIIGVMELENDGFDPPSAAQDFISLAGEMTGEAWAVARPVAEDIGDDAITVGLFYRNDQVKAIGPAETLGGREFENSRQPVAQLFQQLPDGERILVIVNHLKSKGSCPESGKNVDQKDGQGCWNPIRTDSATRMSAWAKSLAVSKRTGNILILGDMNAYRNEDPINTIRKAGFVELMDGKPTPAYSFAYYGQHGSLDYAFASEALLERVRQASIWNVNAAFPVGVDLPQPWLRFSDHDPVVVDILLRHSSTSD